MQTAAGPSTEIPGKPVQYYESQGLRNADLIISTADAQFQAGEIDYLQWVILVDQAMTIKSEHIQALEQLQCGCDRIIEVKQSVKALTMKKYIIICLHLWLLLTSCGSGDPKTGAAYGAGKHRFNQFNEQTVSFNAQQFKSVGIEVGTPQMEKISGTLSLAG
jgi:hypothetical protein